MSDLFDPEVTVPPGQPVPPAPMTMPDPPTDAPPPTGLLRGAEARIVTESLAPQGPPLVAPATTLIEG